MIIIENGLEEKKYYYGIKNVKNKHVEVISINLEWTLILIYILECHLNAFSLRYSLWNIKIENTLIRETILAEIKLRVILSFIIDGK